MDSPTLGTSEIFGTSLGDQRVFDGVVFWRDWRLKTLRLSLGTLLLRIAVPWRIWGLQAMWLPWSMAPSWFLFRSLAACQVIELTWERAKHRLSRCLIMQNGTDVYHRQGKSIYLDSSYSLHSIWKILDDKLVDVYFSEHISKTFIQQPISGVPLHEHCRWNKYSAHLLFCPRGSADVAASPGLVPKLGSFRMPKCLIHGSNSMYSGSWAWR